MRCLRLVLGMLLGTVVLLAGCGGNDSNDHVTGPVGGGGREPGPTAWWNDQVFYEVFVRSFYDANSDGIGDLQGLIDKLDYLNDGDPATTTDLGVTALWLMPVQSAASYHGYDATDYRTVEPDYGTNADFQSLMAAAHARGLRVIIDLVMNHTSDQHPWFASEAASGPWSPTSDTFYRWNTTDPGTTQPWGADHVWHLDTNGRYYYGLFWSGMPDLNYGNPAVVDTMFDVADFWLDSMDADGFRLDAVRYIQEDGGTLQDVPATFAFWGDFHDRVVATRSDAYLVGEAWAANDIVLRYTQAGVTTCFAFDLASAIVGAAVSGNPSHLRATVVDLVDRFPYVQWASFLANHDMVRLADQLGRDGERNRLAAAMLLTLPGVPYLYYGEEVGMLGDGADETKRRPMQWTDDPVTGGFTAGTPWEPLGSNVATNNVALMAADSTSLWNAYRRLVQVRTMSAALRRGTYEDVAASQASTYAYLRYLPDESVVVVHNLAAGITSPPNLALDSSRLEPGAYTASDLVTGRPLAGVVVNARGGFAAWNPIPALTGRQSVLVKITPVP